MIGLVTKDSRAASTAGSMTDWIGVDVNSVAEPQNVIYGLSCACHPEAGVRYVGMTGRGAQERLKWHGYEAGAPSKTRPVHKWFRKHGISNIVSEILESSEVRKGLGEREVYWIAKLRAEGIALLNLTDGGELGTPGYVRSPELRAHSAAMQRGKRLGAENPFFGRKHSAEFSAGASLRNAGAGNVKAKLSETNVRDIRERAATESTAELALAYGVHWATIRAVVRRRTWKHVA